MPAPGRRFLALAGERALGLDTAQGEARLARALELSSEDDPERAQFLVRWADAAFQAGRGPEAADALDDALGSLRERGETETIAQALRIRSRVSLRLADGCGLALAAEAVDLLEQEPSRPALVAAYSQLASAQWLRGSYTDAVLAADRARALAEELGLPEPARALGYRGMARSYLGEPSGIAEMERALAMLLESGAGRDAAVAQNNLAIARYPTEGVARSLAAFEAGIAFCRQRGVVEVERALAANCPGLLAELGRPDEALAQAGELAAALETVGQTTDLLEVRAVEHATHHARGDRTGSAEIEWLVETARKVGEVHITTFALACAAVALVPEAPDLTRDLLVELERGTGVRQTPYYARQLPAIVRAALAIGDRALAQRLVDGLEPRYPLDEYTLCAARAQLAEHAGKHAGAAALYAEAAGHWKEFGNVSERAYAFLGQGRCLLALGRPGEKPLREARDLFASMGYKPALAETEALLEHTTAPAS